MEQLSSKSSLDVSKLAEGDFRFSFEMASGTETVQHSETTLSRIHDLQPRLERLERLLKEPLPDQASVVQSTDRATCKQLVRLIRSQFEGNVPESDYPAHRLLKMCEAMLIEKVNSVELLRNETKRHDVWLALSDTKKQVSVRVRCPAESSEPMPVVFAFHGAGGSENMFFETYGAGRLVELATQRGWMVVAPRQGLLGLNLDAHQMVDVLAQYYNVDQDKIFFIGHSMGAAQVMQQVTRDPELPAAAVAIGGGGRMANAKQVAEVPWLVAAGEFDFGRSGAKSLADSLTQFSAKARYVEYANVEHMVIVQACLDEVFAFLDSVSGTTKP